jgi:hypothetical protein
MPAAHRKARLLMLPQPGKPRASVAHLLPLVKSDQKSEIRNQRFMESIRCVGDKRHLYLPCF